MALWFCRIIIVGGSGCDGDTVIGSGTASSPLLRLFWLGSWLRGGSHRDGGSSIWALPYRGCIRKKYTLGKLSGLSIFNKQ